ncbi:hypothetical protein QO001_004490 [Methylobacterium brachiatum]|jgi:hypothetical protein|uniref:Uncharacterized protein n=1 Tax=Methylobacterium brachiatum TaxID=269660 RepID=A0AAJ1TRK4_9HYPH|nr:hypothetical protein [Methylobacterium brachiatum]
MVKGGLNRSAAFEGIQAASAAAPFINPATSV